MWKRGAYGRSFFRRNCKNPDVYARQGNNVAKSNKVAVCHNNGNITYVNENALPAHIVHGDVVVMDSHGFFDKENSWSAGMACDDTNADVNPDAEENYTDYIDNNCNGNIGYIETRTEMVPCSDCGGVTTAQYQNRKGKCRDTPAPNFSPCPAKIQVYID